MDFVVKIVLIFLKKLLKNPKKEVIAEVKKMELKLLRKDYGEKATEGELYINGVFECYTLEDKVRPYPEKVEGETAIWPNTYKIIIDFSDRFQRLMPHILDVLLFTGIRFHWGNRSKDTKGCVLVGKNKVANDPDFIGTSQVAFDALFKKLETAINNGEEIWITIVNT